MTKEISQNIKCDHTFLDQAERIYASRRLKIWSEEEVEVNEIVKERPIKLSKNQKIYKSKKRKKTLMQWRMNFLNME
jgi:hypothetical protein